MTALHLITDAPWAIQQSALKTISEIADRSDISSDNLAQWKHEAVEAVDGEQVSGARFHMRGNVAVIDVIGPIFRFSNLFTDISGATSLNSLSKDFNKALNDPDVESILLNVNSPGGQADGIAEFADMVRAGTSVKPIKAFVGGVGASAAYWIAAAADNITIAKTGFAGSIGVVATFQDTSDRDAKAGIKELKFISSSSPNKQLDPTTDEGASDIQAQVDRLAVEFVGAVAEFRGVSVETVLSDFGQGGVQMGADAVNSGLVDAVGSFEETLASMVSVHSVHLEGNTMAEQTPTVEAVEPKPLTLESVKADHPGIAAALVSEGATCERDRILGIEANSLPGHDALVANLKADGKTTPEQAAVQVLNAERGKGAAAMDNMVAAVEAVPAVEADTGESAVTINANLPLKDRCEAKWNGDADLRGQFDDDFDCYMASEKAMETGQSRILKK